jgi:hypothetical protein
LHCGRFLIILRPLLSCNYSLFIHQSCLLAAEVPNSKAGSRREMTLNLAYVVSLSYSAGILTCRKILRLGTDGFTSPPKECEPLSF